MSTTLISPFSRDTFRAASTSLPGEFHFVKLAADGRIDLPSAGDRCIVLLEAVFQGASYVVNESYTCAFEGVVKVKAGAALNAGVSVSTDSSGQAVAATSGQAINGVTLDPCAQGDFVRVRASLTGAKA